jgi:ABC-type antimicrobial peptide transport system permease subunit
MRGFAIGERARGGLYEVTGGYFDAIGARMVAGREFTHAEVQAGAPVAVIGAAAARLVWPTETATAVVGRVLRLLDQPERLVVGVVNDLRENYGQEAEPALFIPLGAEPASYRNLLIRMAPGIEPSLPALRARLTARLGDRRVSLFSVEDDIDESSHDHRFRATLLSVFGICGLVLAAAGIYALAAYDVAVRKREMGIRLTLGATPGRLRSLVAGQVVKPVLIGSVVGLAMAYWAARFLEAFLYKVDARDPMTALLGATLLVSTAFVGAWLPARRAARTDPASVLRAD